VRISFSRVKKIICALICLSAAPVAHADVEGVVVWEPTSNGVRYLLPKLRGISPSELAQRYETALRASAVYGRMEGAQSLKLLASAQTFSELPASTAEHPNVAVILNRPAQMHDGQTVLFKAVRAFQKEGPRLFAIPIGLGTVLTSQEMDQFRKKLNSMDGQFGMGGDDPHPLFYGQTDTSRTRGDISLERDQEIAAYFREYLEHGKGKVFYVCGSMQRAAAMNGRKLHDDISHLTRAQHMKDNHELAAVEVIAEEGSELAAAAGSRRFITSNYHHVAVKDDHPQGASGKPPLRVTAYNIEPDGTRGRVVKAIEFSDHAGFATQFHPELGSFPEEKRIIQYVATGWKMRARVAPSVILRCMRSAFERRLERPLESHGMLVHH
jgi:gamma-glutamyl-gamma-aminobutyrate hydrolase PuuD